LQRGVAVRRHEKHWATVTYAVRRYFLADPVRRASDAVGERESMCSGGSGQGILLAWGRAGQSRDHRNTISQRLTLRNLSHEEMKLRVELRNEARQPCARTPTRRLRTWPRDPSRRSLDSCKTLSLWALSLAVARSLGLLSDRLDRLVRRLIARTNISKNMPSKNVRDTRSDVMPIPKSTRGAQPRDRQAAGPRSCNHAQTQPTHFREKLNPHKPRRTGSNYRASEARSKSSPKARILGKHATRSSCG
jgi:hypothetical protein